jgi:hypothetical protein
MTLLLVSALAAPLGVFAGVFLAVLRLLALSPLVFATILAFARGQDHATGASVGLALIAVVIFQAGYLAGILFRTWRDTEGRTTIKLLHRLHERSARL